MLCVGAAIFASSSAYSSEKVTIRVSYVNSYTKPIHDEIARRFSQLNPDITVVLSSPVETWGEQVQRTILDTATGNGPDVAEQSFNLFGQISDRGLAQPLDALIKQEKNWQSMGYSPALTNLGAYKGKHWGLPFRISVPIVYFNENLVRAVGVNPRKFPSDWNDILQAARKISALGRPTRWYVF